MSLAAAIKTGDTDLLPSRRDEDWRWTDLRGLLRSLPAPSPTGGLPVGTGPFAWLDDHIILNGYGEKAIKLFAGEERVVSVRFIAGPDAGTHSTDLAVHLGEGASLVLLETYEGSAAGYLSDVSLAFTLAGDARLERIVIAEDGPDGVCVSTATAHLGAGAAFAQTVLTTGAKRQRLETRVIHPGAGADVRLDGVYLLADRRHADITTVVTHEGVNGTTRQLVKGMVRDQSRAVFQGRIVVSPGADQTDARMGHHALILGDRAEVDAKPELEIWADDVACAHGNTVGALDAEALFYAAQRGIPDGEARAMLTTAFVGEVIDRIEHDAARNIARAWVDRQLTPAPAPCHIGEGG